MIGAASALAAAQPGIPTDVSALAKALVREMKGAGIGALTA